MSGRIIRSKRKRFLVWLKTKGKCTDCSIRLPSDWEVDHIIRRADGGDDSLDNLQPLCKPCHIAKTSLENSNRPLIINDWPALRRGHREGIQRIIEVLTVQDEKFCSVVLPTRYGKSHLARLLAYAARLGIVFPDGRPYPGFADYVVLLTHLSFLRRQIVMAEKWEDFRRDMFIPDNVPSIRFKQQQLQPNDPDRIAQNGEAFISANIQTVAKQVNASRYDGNPTVWERFASENRVIFIADEAQFYGIEDGEDDLLWGPCLDRLASAGGKILTMTATPLRADGRSIPGFLSGEQERKQWTQVRHAQMPGENGELKTVAFLDRYERLENEVIPHFEVKRREAWDNKYLCIMDRVEIDVRLDAVETVDGEIVATHEGAHYLHDLEPRQAKKLLGDVVRKQEVIAAHVSKALERMSSKRNSLPDAAIICFSQNDIKGKESHADAIKKQFNAVAPDLKVVIATQSNDDDESANELIERFQEGDGDVLILKQMAGAGFDCPRVKVTLDLSATRQMASTEQRWNRSATPAKQPNGGMMTTCDLVVPAEPLARNIWDKIYHDQPAITKDDAELIDSEEIELTNSTRFTFSISDIEDGDGADFDGHQADSVGLRLGAALVSLMPGSESGTTITRAAHLAAQFNLTEAQLVREGAKPGRTYTAPPPPAKSTDEIVADLKRSIHEIVKKITKKLFYRKTGHGYSPHSHSDGLVYGKIVSAVRKKLADRAGVPDYRQEQNIQKLEAYLELTKEEAAKAGVEFI